MLNSTGVEISKEDQKNINTFSKLYGRKQELEESHKKLKERKEHHQDTLDEIDMNDDEELLRYRFGVCFIELPTKQVRSLVGQEIAKTVQEAETLEKEIEDICKKLKKLKATLYSKFGNSINLQE